MGGVGAVHGEDLVHVGGYRGDYEEDRCEEGDEGLEDVHVWLMSDWRMVSECVCTGYYGNGCILEVENGASRTRSV